MITKVKEIAFTAKIENATNRYCGEELWINIAAETVGDILKLNLSDIYQAINEATKKYLSNGKINYPIIYNFEIEDFEKAPETSYETPQTQSATLLARLTAVGINLTTKWVGCTQTFLPHDGIWPDPMIVVLGKNSEDSIKEEYILYSFTP